MPLTDMLLQSGRIRKAAADEASSRAQLLGGSIESHLLRLGAVTEQDLCDALARCCNCEAVALGDISLHPHVLALLDPSVAIERSLLPLTYDESASRLTVACLDPTDTALAEFVRKLTSVREVHLVAAIEPILRCRVIDAYRHVTTPLEFSDEPAAERDRGTVFLVGPVDPVAEAFASALAGERVRVVLVDSVEEAIQEIDNEPPSGVIVRDRRRECYTPLLDRLRKIAPACPVRFAESLGDLVQSDVVDHATVDLVSADLRLCLSLLCSEEELASGEVDRYCRTVDRVCRRLDLPGHDRMLVVNAAYLGELARLYLGAGETPDWEQSADELGAAAGWPPALTAILRRRESDVDDVYPDRLPLPTLGGNILRVADYFRRRQDAAEPLTFDRYEAIKLELRRLSGVQFLPETIEAFQAVLIEELSPHEADYGDAAQVLILAEKGSETAPLQERLGELGFEVLVAPTPDRFTQLYERHWPEFLVVVTPGSAERVNRTVADLLRRGIDTSQAPLFVLADSPAVSDLVSLLSDGVEDVIPLDRDIELLTVKLARLRSRLEAENDRRLSVLQDMGTHGTLADMNVIDLLQAMGHAQKTVRISITACGSQLTMYLCDGQLISAECDDLSGPEAVYASLRWTQGIWSVDPISPDGLPGANNDEPIDAILIEGCRRLDEARRGDGIPDESAGDASIDNLPFC